MPKLRAARALLIGIEIFLHDLPAGRQPRQRARASPAVFGYGYQDHAAADISGYRREEPLQISRPRCVVSEHGDEHFAGTNEAMGEVACTGLGIGEGRVDAQKCRFPFGVPSKRTLLG